MDVILSIRPKHVEAIRLGKKHYEFRKIIFRREVERVYIYSTSPIMKITGYFKVGEIIQDKPNALWNALNECAGISREEFFNYYRDTAVGFAIKIQDAVFFESPIDPYEFDTTFYPPQSIRYLNIRTN